MTRIEARSFADSDMLCDGGTSGHDEGDSSFVGNELGEMDEAQRRRLIQGLYVLFQLSL